MSKRTKYNTCEHCKEELEKVICSACDGTGEGSHDGTVCYTCHGSGIDDYFAGYCHNCEDYQ